MTMKVDGNSNVPLNNNNNEGGAVRNNVAENNSIWLKEDVGEQGKFDKEDYNAIKGLNEEVKSAALKFLSGLFGECSFEKAGQYVDRVIHNIQLRFEKNENIEKENMNISEQLKVAGFEEQEDGTYTMKNDDNTMTVAVQDGKVILLKREASLPDFVKNLPRKEELEKYCKDNENKTDENGNAVVVNDGFDDEHPYYTGKLPDGTSFTNTTGSANFYPKLDGKRHTVYYMPSETAEDTILEDYVGLDITIPAGTKMEQYTIDGKTKALGYNM